MLVAAGCAFVAPAIHAQPQAQAQTPPSPSAAEPVPGNEAAFINDMVTQYHFDRAQLEALLANVQYSEEAVRLVAKSSPRPGGGHSTKNWRAQQARFIEPVRINAGVRFWQNNQPALQRAYRETGVPPAIIAGILGTETIYGRDMGSFPVLDVLTTLAFDYPDTPNRAERMVIFRDNLRDYLIWTRNENIDPTTVQGSFTGAIGIAQFLPGNILQYGVDYDGDQHVDLRNSMADAIGSVANYMKGQGWEPGRPVVWAIASDATSQRVAAANATGQADLHLTLGELAREGLTLADPGINVAAEANTPVTIVDLPTPGRPTQYLLGLKNFYVITRYNHSFFYAMTVYDLGQQVKAQAANVPRNASTAG
jgi:membrane-bound lytic murein transglycosylase B